MAGCDTSLAPNDLHKNTDNHNKIFKH